jgi:hypothetical protein
MSVKHYRFNLFELEEKVLHSYHEWEKNKLDHTLRTNLFLSIKNIAYAILSVGDFVKYEIDFDKTAYEYALNLLERIIKPETNEGKKPFRFVANNPGGRFPVQNYINLNIRDTIFSMKKENGWKNLVEDLEFYLNKIGDEEAKSFDEINPIENNLQNFFYAKKLLKSLRIFYSFEDIRRLLYISLDLIYSNKSYLISDNIPNEIKDFTITLICLAKKLTYQSNINFSIDIKKDDLQKLLLSATRSTIMLATVANSNLFSKELLLSLDIDSLNRLVAVAGGKVIKVPTKKDLETLIGSIVCISKSVMEGEDPISNLNKIKYDYDLVFNSGITITKTISKVIETFDVFKEDNNSKALINLLVISVKSLDVLFQKLVDKSDDLPVDTILKQYTELNASFSRFTESLVSIKKGINNEQNIESESVIEK